MAWTTPPTFVNGQQLTATDLNTLGEDIAYLKGVASAINMPVALVSGDQSFVWRYLVVHRHNTLHVKYHITGGPASAVNLRYNGTAMPLSPESGTSNENYNISALALTVGTPYVFEIEYKKASNSVFYLDELWEQG